MKIVTALPQFLVMIMPALYAGLNAVGAEGISTVNSESETVSAAPGKAVSARCTCPAGTEVIGGGGECTGFPVTDGWVSIAKSSPVPDGASWYVECVNTGSRPGEIQAKAWAICADPAFFNTNKKK